MPILGLSDNEQLRKDILTVEEKSREARVVQAGRRLSFKEAQKLDSENEQMPTSDTSKTNLQQKTYFYIMRGHIEPYHHSSKA